MYNQEWLTAAQVAEIICGGLLSGHTIRKYARDGKLPHSQVGGKGSKMLFKKETALKFFKERNFPIACNSKEIKRDA